MDQYDDEEGLPEKLVIKNQQYHKYVLSIRDKVTLSVGFRTLSCLSLWKVLISAPFFLLV